MISKALYPLRRRMIEDMTIRQFGGKTKSDYIRQAREFAVFLGCSPDRAEPEDLRRPAPSRLVWGQLCPYEPDRDGAAVLLPHDVGPNQFRQPHGPHPPPSGCRSCSAPRRSRCSWPTRRA